MTLTTYKYCENKNCIVNSLKWLNEVKKGGRGNNNTISLQILNNSGKNVKATLYGTICLNYSKYSIKNNKRSGGYSILDGGQELYLFTCK